MLRYVTYESSTGKIIGSGTAMNLADVYLYANQSAIVSDVAGVGTHYVDTGTSSIIEYSAAAKLAYANPPQGNFAWSPSAGTWIDNRTLAEAKADAWTTIKARRETAFAARAVSVYGIAYSITKDKGNLGDRIKSLEAAIQIGMATSSTTAIWRDLDDAEHPLSIVGYYALAAEMGARGQAIYQRSWALDAQVKAATSNGALDSIDYDGGWP